MAGNGILQLRSANNAFDTTTFFNPTGSLTIHASGSARALTISGLPDFSAALTLGATNQPFKNITFAGAVTLAADKNLYIAANDGIVALPNATSRVSTQGSGTIFVWGLASLATGAALTSELGDIEINNGFNAWTGSFTGIQIVGGTISSRSGSITLKGHGGASGDGNRGILIDAGASIVTGEQGGLSIEGSGGYKFDATTNPGVEIRGASVLETTGSGYVSVHGSGGQSSLGANSGLVLRDLGTTIRANSGGAYVSGFSYGTKTGTNCAGVHISDGVVITVNTGEISGSGYGKLGDRESSCTGLSTTGPATPSISSSSAPGYGIRLTGVAGNPSMIGLKLDSAAVSISGNRFLDLYADRMTISPTAAISAPAGRVEIRAIYPNSGINLGSSTNAAPNTLEISDAELDRITADGITINLTTGGPLVVSSDITRASPTYFTLASSGSIEFAGGSLNTADRLLTLWPHQLATIRAKTPGNDAILGQSYLSLGVPGNLKIDINGTAVDSQYDQLSVQSGVHLRDFNLVLSLGFQPKPGDKFTIVNNSGSFTANSQFTNLPDGSLITATTGSYSAVFQINYRGGDGNDVVLTAINVAPTLDQILNPNPIAEDAGPQSLGLTGIAPGFGHSILKVTAVSSNRALIPDPEIAYSSVNGTGTLSYKPVAHQYGSTTITVTVQDDGGTDNGRTDTITRTFAINVTPINDPPSGADKIINPFPHFTLLEDGAYTFSVADFGFRDPNDTPADSFLAVKITTLPTRGVLSLGGSTQTVVPFVVPVVNILALSFAPAPNESGFEYAAFTFQVIDTGGTFGGGIDTDQTPNTITINVQGLNDAPIGTDGQITLLEDGSHNFSVSDFGFTDSNDSPFLHSFASLRIATLPANGALFLGNNQLTNPATAVIPVGMIGQLRFVPAANANGTAYSQFTFQVQDNGGISFGGVDVDQTPNTLTLNVTPVNDPPLSADSTVAVLEDLQHVIGPADFGFADPFDSPANNLQAVIIQSLPTFGSLTNGTFAVTVGQTFSAADIAAGLLRFTPVPSTSGAFTGFNFFVQDNGGTSSGGIDISLNSNTLTIHIVSFCGLGAPTIGRDFTFNLLEDSSYTFFSPSFDLENPFDLLDGANQIRIVTLPTVGTLIIEGVAVTTGQIIPGSDITAGHLRYFPPPNAVGNPLASFIYQALNDGQPPMCDDGIGTIALNVLSVNDPPRGADSTVTISEDTSYPFQASDFFFSDPNDSPPNAFEAVRITTLPVQGTLQLSGSVVSVGQIISRTQLASLVFIPAFNTNNSNTPPPLFTFQVRDNGSVANDGSNLDPTPNTLTFNVTAVNDPPSGADRTIEMLPGASYIFSDTDFPITDPIDSPANSLAFLRIVSLPVVGTLTFNGNQVTIATIVPLAGLRSGQLVYHAPSALPGCSPFASFGFRAIDNGGTALNGIDEDPSSNTILLQSPSNRAPDGTNGAISVLEDQNDAFTAADFGFTDPDGVFDSLRAVKVSTLPALGSLLLAGAPVAAGQLILASDIAAGGFTFMPLPDASGSALAGFTFQVQDNGGFAGCGGKELDATPNTITINVTPVNDPPSFVPAIVPPVPDEGGVQSFSDWATLVSVGPADEVGQQVQFFVVGNTNPGIFLAPPTIDANGHLTFSPRPNAKGTAAVQIIVKDDGGTANGGIDTSALQTLTIEVVKARVWHNAAKRLDVSGNDAIVAGDALDVINFLNAFGPQSVPDDGRAQGPYYDTTGDGFVTAADALEVINHLNAGLAGEGEGPGVGSQGPEDSGMEDLMSLLAADVAGKMKRKR